MRGRKPLPTELKLLNGNPGKRPINKREPKPPATAPACPSWLPREGKAEWARVVPALDKLHLLAKIDRAALAAYCSAWAALYAAEVDIKEHGYILEVPDRTFTDPEKGTTTVIVKRTKNPSVLIARDSAAQVRQYCAEFGLTPSSRSRMELPGGSGSGDSAGARFLS